MMRGITTILTSLPDLAQIISMIYLSTQSGILNIIDVTSQKLFLLGSWNSSSDTMKANLSLGIGVSVYGIVNGTITLTGSFTTSRGTLEPPAAAAGILTATDENGNANATSKDLGNWVVDIIKALPLQDAVPAN